ncbi:hypothetical protein FACS189460_4540 [Deltaproteobacteria bacterium]|nr:hypothetical protein FACS189460_4540 [Deltaproteobacteria bacterium]
MNIDTIYKIKDSVDLFLSDDNLLTVYHINTRQRRKFKVSTLTVSLIEQIDGDHTLMEIIDNMSKFSVDSDSVTNVISSLEAMRIVATKDLDNSLLEIDDINRFDRQINYFSEFFSESNAGLIAQNKLFSQRVLIFGCGAIGSNIALLLGMSGVRTFTLFDFDIVEESDIARHMIYSKAAIGATKTSLLAHELKNIDSKISINIVDDFMRPDSDIEKLIIESDFIINTLDMPYIGYTASKISRVCVKHNKPHFIAGGFDAHLASTGEIIIPYVTPCVECYASHFKTSLKNWKPKQHPVEERYNEIGGLSSMSLFSASFAAIEIIKYITGLVDMNNNFKVRGEFLFDNMELIYINVEKNPSCIICGGKNES